jgi:hypothetical protein
VLRFDFVRDALLTGLTEMSPAIAIGIKAIREWEKFLNYDLCEGTNV